MKKIIATLSIAICLLGICAMGACGKEKEETPEVKITLSEKSIELSVGETKELTVSVTPNDVADKTITWKTEDKKIATVDKGTVTAIEEGETNIIVETNGQKDTCKVIVKAKQQTETPEQLPENMPEGEMGANFIE